LIKGVNMKTIKIFLLAVIVLCTFSALSAAQDGQIQWDTIPQQTRVALFEAQQAMNESRFQDAIDSLVKFQKRKKKYDHFLIEFNIGTAYGFLGDVDKAVEHLHKATEIETTYAPLWLNLGKLYYQKKDFLHSAAALEKGFVCSLQKNSEVLFMAMAAYYQGENLEKTIEIGEELVSTYNKDSFEIVSLLANAYVTTNNYTGAIDMLNRLLNKNPSNEKAWKLLTQAYFKNQQYREAAISYEIYGFLQPITRDELIVMGDLFNMIGIPLRAAHYYHKALKDGGSPKEYEKMSVAYYSAYEFNDAIDAIDRALDTEKTSERLLLKAQLFYLQDKFGEAQKLYVSAAETMSKDGHEWLMAGYCAMRNNEIKIAKELLHKATGFPSQRQEALAMLKMMQPVEEVKRLMAAFEEQMKHTKN